MLGNVVVPPFYFAALWGIVLIPMLVEIAVEVALLRGYGLRDLRFTVFLVAFNLITWPALFLATARLGSLGSALIVIAVLEAIVALVEACLIWLAALGKLLSMRFGFTPIRFRHALVVSAAGNATSFLLGVLLVALVFLV